MTYQPILFPDLIWAIWGHHTEADLSKNDRLYERRLTGALRSRLPQDAPPPGWNRAPEDGII